METENNKKKKKNIFLLAIKHIKLRHLLMLIALLAVNSYAWFIYVNTVSNSVDVHVRAWKINFEDGQQEIVNYVNVDVGNIYPGMTTFTKDIVAYNYGEVDANVEYKILSATILGNEIVTQEGKTDRGLVYNQSDPTSAELEATFNSAAYPFHITFGLSSATMGAGTGSSTYSVNVSWAYNSGNDAADTQWGVDAYDFMEDNPGDPCITLQIKIYITQAQTPAQTPAEP